MPSQAIAHHGRIVRASVRTTATPDRVWAAWTAPDRLSGWFTDRMEGEVRPGASITWCFDRFGAKFSYDVLVAEPLRRLVLKGSPVGRPPFILEIRMEPDGSGTEVRIINSGFSANPESDEEHDGVVSGWHMALAILRHYLAHHDGEPRQPFFAMQPALFEYDEILHFFTEAAGLGTWLTTEGSIGEVGSRYALTLRDGTSMSGTVLALTDREVAMSWEQINGAIELKSFKLGPKNRAVCVRGSGWNLAEEKAEAIEVSMIKSIDGLASVLSDLHESLQG